jgi:hypothetical protein
MVFREGGDAVVIFGDRAVVKGSAGREAYIKKKRTLRGNRGEVEQLL